MTPVRESHTNIDKVGLCKNYGKLWCCVLHLFLGQCLVLILYQAICTNPNTIWTDPPKAFTHCLLHHNLCYLMVQNCCNTMHLWNTFGMSNKKWTIFNSMVNSDFYFLKHKLVVWDGIGSVITFVSRNMVLPKVHTKFENFIAKINQILTCIFT